MSGAAANDAATWRPEIDALAFRPAGHAGTCAIHRLAFRTLLGGEPTPEACLGYFADAAAAFGAAAAGKIRRRGLASGANFHLTSRDVRAALAPAGLTPVRTGT